METGGEWFLIVCEMKPLAAICFDCLQSLRLSISTSRRRLHAGRQQLNFNVVLLLFAMRHGNAVRCV